MWEEGPSGELLIVQNLLVPRKSHMVSDRREMGSMKGGSLGPVHVHPCCDPVSLGCGVSVGKSQVPSAVSGCSVTPYTFPRMSKV